MNRLSCIEIVFSLCAATLAVACRADATSEIPVAAATLRADLLTISRTLLAPAGLRFDAEHVRLVTSRPVADGESFVAKPHWLPVASEPPASPLVFDLHPTNGNAAPVRATLIAPLQRDVLVLRQRADRGTPIHCEDVDIQAKPLRLVPIHSLVPPCSFPPDAHARRALLPGEVLRRDDAGPLPDVAAYGAVRVRVVVGAIAIERTGTASSDAREGETVRVRLNGGAQTVTGRVLARNLVVMEAAE